MVTPAGGVQDVSFEAVEREFFKGDNPVEPSVPPKDSAPVSRIAKKELGEIRGADLTMIEFMPIANIRGSTEVNRIWIPEATITVEFSQPLNDAIDTPALLQEAVGAVAVNAEDLPRCIGRVSAEKV